MRTIPALLRLGFAVIALALGAGAGAAAQAPTVTRATELRAERFLDAVVVGRLAVGQAVQLLRLEAGWAQVSVGGTTGWVRPSNLRMPSGPAVAAVATGESGRGGRDNSMSTTGIRSVPRASRHALVIGIGEYSAPGISRLAGVPVDMRSARDIAGAMGIPDSNITYLRDAQATAQAIRRAIGELNTRVREGDRVFIYFSGHGTRWIDPQIDANACTEGLVASDGQTLTNREVSNLLAPISRKTDKLMVFYDACHSGGVANQPLRTRSLQPSQGMSLVPKFTSQISPEACAQPSNLRTRSLSGELGERGAMPQNVVFIAASRPDEVSFDDATIGGLATSAWRQCMLGAAQDRDGSGSLSVDEITACAQVRIDRILVGQPDILGQRMTIGGNRHFVPGAFADVASASPPSAAPSPGAQPAAPAAMPSPPAAAAPPPAPLPPGGAPPPATPAANPVDPVAVMTPALPEPPADPVSSAGLLHRIHEQRDAARTVTAAARPPVLRIGQDPLRLSITSSHDGYLYVALAGSDGNSLYLLYPNALDADNGIRANAPVELPGPRWRITAAGPAGTDTLLVLVADSPRDLSLLGEQRAGPFLKSLQTPEGRGRLQWLMGNSENADDPACQDGGATRNLRVGLACSDAFGSALLRVEER